MHSRRLLPEFPGDGIKCIEKLKSHCDNMTFADRSRYDIIFQQVTHKGGESAINYINKFHHAETLSVSVGNTYPKDQLIQTFLDDFHRGGKYSAQTASHQAELRREGNFTDQKSLSISSLETDYINLDRRSSCGKNSESENIIHTWCNFCGGANHSAEKKLKVSERKWKHLVWMVIQTTEVQNICLGNILDVDLKIT